MPLVGYHVLQYLTEHMHRQLCVDWIASFVHDKIWNRNCFSMLVVLLEEHRLVKEKQTHTSLTITD